MRLPAGVAVRALARIARIISPAREGSPLPSLPLTIGILQTLHNQSDRYTRLQLSLTHGESRAAEEHRAILQVARERDVETACALLHSHILDAGRSLVDFLRVHRSAEGERRELA